MVIILNVDLGLYVFVSVLFFYIDWIILFFFVWESLLKLGNLFLYISLNGLFGLKLGFDVMVKILFVLIFLIIMVMFFVLLL